MQSEIQFLIDLLLSHKLSEPIRKILIARIGEVEQDFLGKIPPTSLPTPRPVVANPTGQCASTMALLEKQANLAQPPVENQIPATVGQTPAAQAALASRSAAIAASLAAKPEAGRTSPRKF